MLADDPDELMALLADAVRATDPVLRELARRLAARIVVDVARRGRIHASGIGTMASLPFRSDGGDIDIDASAEALTEWSAGNALDIERVRQREWVRPATALCLLIDTSGSMRGTSLATAAVGAAAVALRAPARHAVASFAANVLIIKEMHVEGGPAGVVDHVLALRGKGTTDLASALRVAGEQLGSTSASRKVTLLLSDCRANVPGDAVAVASTLDELVIIAPAGDDEQARDLSSRSGASMVTIGRASELPGALADLLG